MCIGRGQNFGVFEDTHATEAACLAVTFKIYARRT